MDVSPNVLRRELVALLRAINVQIEEVKKEADSVGIPMEHMRDSTGNWVMIPLLLAKTQAAIAITQLSQKK